MFRQFSNPEILLKRALAAVLTITLSGAYCLFCCQETNAARTKAEDCPLSKNSQASHCNFSKKKTAETSQSAAGIKVFECCRLKFNFFVAKLEKNEFPQKTPALANNFSFFPQSVKLARKTGFTGFFYRAPVFEKDDLHVRNCVFRI